MASNVWEVVAYDWQEVLETFGGPDAESDAREHAERLDGLALRCFARRKVTMEAAELPTDIEDAERKYRDGLWPVNRIEHRKRFETSVHSMLRVMEECGRGEDVRPGLLETPKRVTKMWLDELSSGYSVDVEGLFKMFDDHGEYDGMVAVKEIPVRSQCEHHLVPFVGYAHVAYFPASHVIGLSKIPRLVDAFSRRLQIQERLTQQIHNALNDHLKPRGVMVVVECEHLCMTLRGVQAPGTKTMTSAVSGLFRDPTETARDEFFQLIRGT